MKDSYAKRNKRTIWIRMKNKHDLFLAEILN